MNVYEEISLFYEGYRGEKRIIGSSVEGRNLYAFFIGAHKKPVILSQYAIHAREWITAYLALAHIKRGLLYGGAWIIPLMNPDGALLVEEGITSVRRERREFLLHVNGSSDFSLFKANARAVDLNVNFEARWGTGRHNLTRPAPQNYIGESPFSEPETCALRNFTYAVSPALTLSWHTKGEEIYSGFHEGIFRAHKNKRYAKLLSSVTGYPVKKTPHSAGGYKDWCIERLKIPAFTIEAGSDAYSHPLGFHALGSVVVRNINVLAALTAGKK